MGDKGKKDRAKSQKQKVIKQQAVVTRKQEKEPKSLQKGDGK